jgi:hypothetical protein
MRRSLLGIVLVCVLSVGAGLVPSTAGAAGVSGPVADCNQHLGLTHHYSAQVLRSALQTMQADVKEYSDCYDVIQRALLAEIGPIQANGSGSGGGSFLPIPVIVILAVAVLGGVGYATVAWYRRSG